MRLTIKEKTRMRNRRRLKNRRVSQLPLSVTEASPASQKVKAPYSPPVRWVIDEDDQLITRLGLKRL